MNALCVSVIKNKLIEYDKFLCKSCKTRWNYLYYMLYSVDGLTTNQLEEVLQLENMSKLSTKERSIISELLDILKPFNI